MTQSRNSGNFMKLILALIPIGVFCTDNKVYKIMHFQFQVCLVNKKTKDLS
jgi:hypothetical protein